MIDSFQGEFRFLSNFYSAPVVMDAKLYPTIEHAYQAAKTFDLGMREQIRLAATPSVAKRLGRLVLLRPDWDTFRLEAMEELLRQKFAKPTLRPRLIETWPHELVEGNTWGDTFWGAVLVHRPTPWDSEPVPCWDGENHLGRLLMKIRNEITSGGVV